MPPEKQLNINDSGVFRLLAVVVLYKMKPAQSACFATLQKAFSCLGHGQADIKILLYDNTPKGQDPGFLPDDVIYKANADNGGVSVAYNYALELAQHDGYDWLLTLDQDTRLPEDFLCKLYDAAMFIAPMQDVAAVAPKLTSDGRDVSPFTLTKYLRIMRHYPDEFVGIPLKAVDAINSGYLIKVSALNAIGGYDRKLTLDFCDIALGNRLHSKNLRVYVAGNIHVVHELSVFELMQRADSTRYENILRAEEYYYDKYLGRRHGAVLLLRLLFRVLYRLGRAGATRPYFFVAMKYISRRAFFSRRHRLKSQDCRFGLLAPGCL